MATSADEAAKHEAAAEAVEAAPAPPVTTEETDAAANEDAAPATGDDNAPKKRGRKRKVSATEDKAPGATEGEAAAVAVADDAATATGDAAAAPADGVVAAEKSPKEKKSPVAKKPKAAAKAAAAAAAPATPTKRKVGRPRKIVKEESESEDETETELRRRVEALPEDIKAQYGSIVWVKMVGFPYWPALITDPRRLHPKYHVGALKEIETKHYVCFYQSNDFSPALYKNIEMWDDSKHDYRKGHPAKDAKAPKRRIHLMEAIELADKDAPLPIEERMNGLLKEVVEEAESAPEEEEKPVVKRKMGRPLGSKNKPKVVSDDATAAEAAPAAPKAKRGRKKSVEVETEDAGKVTTTPEEEDTAPPLSKDEIKAKVASRKTPSKKKTASAEEKSAAAAAKKAAKAPAKSEPAAKGGELDSKRKKEIELVVPRKSVKSADIREATEEAARKKPGPREKPKDKGEYKVGNLTQFAGKMNRLFANESSKNNDELILLLTQLFEEKMVYRSDVERSGVAAVIAALRKSTNPTVATTASAVRKHLMRVLNDDVTEEANKKHKAEADAGEAKSAKKQKTSPASSEAAAAPAASGESQSNGSSESPKAVVEKEPEQVKVDVKAETAVDEEPSPSPSPAPVDENKPSVKQEPVASAAPSVAPANDVTKPEPVKPSSPVKVEPMVQIPTTPKPDPSGDKARMNCIEMLKKSLAPIGERSAELAREIEAQLFERFSESTQDYQTCARTITFGLKKHNNVLERLKNGSLHALELAYTPEEYFKS